MSASTSERVDPAAALRSVEEGLAALQAGDWSGVPDADLLETFRQFEVVRRRLAAVDHALIGEAETRGLAESLAYRNTAGLLRSLLRITPREAAGRVRAAEAAADRRALTGDPLPAHHPHVAQAQRHGTISAQHAALITRTIAQLPDQVRHEQGDGIERDLVRFAEKFDPDNLARLSRKLLYCYDQDGAEPGNDQRRHRNRTFRLVQRPDGSGYGDFELTAELTELLLTHFDALAGPAPAEDGTPDPRTAGQRRHDALLESLKLAIKARTLPRVNGVTATVIVTMTKKQYESGRGVARTSHGALVPVQEALRWGGYGGDLRLLAVALGDLKPVEAYSTAHRLHNETQRLVLHAVHGGCTFPECPVPPGHTQTHHVIDFADGGPTSVNLAAPVCSREHHRRVAQGWQAKIIDNRVAWTPPPAIDPDQQPRYNELHLPHLLRPHDEDDDDPDP